MTSIEARLLTLSLALRQARSTLAKLERCTAYMLVRQEIEPEVLQSLQEEARHMLQRIDEVLK